ncbi:biosynthetic-type acetolactate synthase large subunit [Zymobacter palmae]|uniref:Acetolactate synthase n=1 Tax=Zymobacter palmae TaxID=33074 RepID=A0A348HC57_9GAMM|nr:biosynthetic-type acetolactate synthase large subunit [Zymobacter palmae]BBG29209.1 thiamine pyrophosphate-requiring enzymes [Zymobacter palmae]
MLSGADMVVRALADEGVEYLFGYPGGAALHIYDALHRQDRVKHILVRHEQGATHMADGYARATGKTGAVLVTSGPGATNTITGIATAYMDSIPMVVLCGQVASHLIGEDAFQETDIIGVTRPIVKHSFTVHHPSEIPGIIRKAFYIASSGRPGPVVIDIPKDMTAIDKTFEYVWPSSVDLRSYQATVRPHGGQVRKAFSALLEARRPVLFAGGGVISGNAGEALTAFARRFDLPVTTSLMGIGAFPGKDRQSLGWPGMHGSVEANTAMHEADLIFCIGARFDDRVTNNVRKFCPDATIVHVDIDPSAISKTVVADIPIVGSASDVLAELSRLADEQKGRALDDYRQALAPWWAHIDDVRQQSTKWRYTPATGDAQPKPQQVVEAVYNITEGKAIVVTDVGQHQMFAAQYYPCERPRQFLTSGGLGTMGYGFPAGIGAKVGCPDQTVVVFTGEGSFQMMMQEFGTCRQYDIPVKIVALNNSFLGMVHQWQGMFYDGRYSESLMQTTPDFDLICRAYGFRAIKVTRADELEAALEDAFRDPNELVMLDIAVEPSEQVYPMQIPGGAMNEMRVSDTEVV